jgi:hypothetical protein
MEVWDMIWRTCLGVLVVLGGMALPAAGQVRLEWKLKKGDEFYAETVTTLKGTATLGEKKSELVSVHAVVTRFQVQKVDANGIVLEERFESVRQKTGGAVIGVPLAAVLGALTGKLDKERTARPVPFTVTVNPSGEVTRFEGYREAMKAVLERIKKKAAADAAMARLSPESLKDLLPEDSLKGFTQDVFIGLPPRALKPGDGWDPRQEVALGPLGSFKASYRYVYKGPQKGDERTHRINIEGSLKYAGPRSQGSGLPFRIIGGNLAVDGVKGTILFDTRDGRLARSELKMHFKGDLKVEAGERKAQVHIDADQTVITQIHASNPLR